MDPFAILPSPLPEMILKFLPDLHSLHSIHNASPAVALLLHESNVAAEIIETIFSQSGDTYGVPPIIQRIIRIMILLHWRPANKDVGITGDAAIDITPLPSTWDTFNPANILRGVRYTVRGTSRPFNYGDGPLPRYSPAPLLCRILALSARIRHLAHRCIHEMVARCMASKPSHLKDPRFFLGNLSRNENPHSRPPGNPYEPRDIGSPSWLEEQRVSRGLWWFALFFFLRDGGAAMLGWRVEEQERMKGLTAFGFWKDLLAGSDYLEAEAAAIWVHGAGMVIEGRCERLPACKVFFSANENEYAWCCKDYRPRVKKGDMNAVLPYPESGTLGYLECYAPGFLFGATSVVNMLGSRTSFMNFKPFHSYGFGIWDLERMIALGFLDTYDGINPCLSLSNLLFTWESILNKQQLEEAEAMRKAEWHAGYFLGQ